MLYVSIGRAHPRLASLLIVQQQKLEETPRSGEVGLLGHTQSAN